MKKTSDKFKTFAVCLLLAAVTLAVNLAVVLAQQGRLDEAVENF